MNFLADECCDAGLVSSLRNNGHDVVYITENLSGSSDEEILLKAYQQNRILLTEDKDFGELVFRLKKLVMGIILIRIGVKERSIKWGRLKRLLDMYGEKIPGNFVVVDSQKFRFRRLLIFP